MIDASTETLEIYFDYVSPFAYIASQLVDDLAHRHGVGLVWKPIELLRLSNFSQGLPYSASKRAYVAVDAGRTAEYHQVPIKPPKPFPVQSAVALRLALVAQELGAFEPFHRLVFRAAWAERRDVGDESVLMDCIRGVSGDPARWFAAATRAEIEQRLSSLTAEAESRGVFGVPTMVLNGELFWGVDSLPILEWRLGGGSPAPRPGSARGET